MGAELSCLHFKHASNAPSTPSANTSTSNSNAMPSSQAMSFEVYTPQPAATSNANANSVTRHHSASRSERRRPSRFSFSESHEHSEEGQSNLSVAQTIPEETSTTDGQPQRSMFAFASSFTLRSKKNTPAPPLAHLYIDPKPVPSMLAYTETTPKGADISQYPHFCPICYRHFADIYRTQCCGHNICYSCSQNHIESKQKLSKANGTKSNVRIPCPTCNSDHVKFERVRKGDKSRIYCESPTTKELMERSQQKQSPVSTSAFYCNTPSMVQAPIHAL